MIKTVVWEKERHDPFRPKESYRLFMSDPGGRMPCTMYRLVVSIGSEHWGCNRIQNHTDMIIGDDEKEFDRYVFGSMMNEIISDIRERVLTSYDSPKEL